MSFKENLKNEMDYQDMQLKELALKTGISKNTLGNYLTGHNSLPNAASAVKIAAALGVSVEYLITGRTDAQPGANPFPPKIRRILDNLQQLDDRDLELVISLTEAMKNRRT